MTITTLQPRQPVERAAGDEESTWRPEAPDAPLWLLAGVEDEDVTRFEPHIWRGID